MHQLKINWITTLATILLGGIVCQTQAEFLLLECDIIECPTKPTCTDDSMLITISDDDENIEDEYYEGIDELATNNPFEGVHIEALGPLQPSSEQPLYVDNDSNKNNDDVSNTVPRTTRSHQYSESPLTDHWNSRKRRETLEDQVRAAQKRCCTQYKCACLTCPELPQCAADQVHIEIDHGTGEPGNCCSNYTCVAKPSCDAESEYWRDACRKCKCYNGEELCLNQCQNDEPKRPETVPAAVASGVYKHDSCYSPYLQKPMVHGAEWYENEYCAKCTCLNGERDCLISLCAPAACSNPVKVKGECCPVCEDMTNTTATTTERNSTETTAITTEITEDNSTTTELGEVSESSQASVENSSTETISEGTGSTDTTAEDHSSSITSETADTSTTDIDNATESTVSDSTNMTESTIIESSSIDSSTEFTTKQTLYVTSSNSEATETTNTSENKPSSSTSTSEIPTSSAIYGDIDSTSKTSVKSTLSLVTESDSTSTETTVSSSWFSSLLTTSSPLANFSAILDLQNTPPLSSTNAGYQVSPATSTSAPAPLPPQPTSWRQDDTAFHYTQGYRRYLPQLTIPQIVAIVSLCVVFAAIIAFVVYCFCLKKHKTGKQYFSVPASEISMSQISDSSNLTIEVR